VVRFGVYVPTFGEYNVETLARLAGEVEAAGWDGFFIWDHLAWTPDGEQELADTTVALTAIALATERVRFGALVTPLVRRRPWKFAKETATLDRLSRGRLVVGVGLGAQGDVAPFGEARRPAEGAEVLDEALEVLCSLWTGNPVMRVGAHFRLDAAVLRPTPLQRPRIPIWVAGFWPNRAPFRRAARFDGALPLARGELLKELAPAELRRCHDYIISRRSSGRPFDLVVFAPSVMSNPETLAAYEDAGATWWVAAVDPRSESLDDFRGRILHGPRS
jgi:alkanesulfonate monooxygenase SsuD/methylene tetrahydromethanopterin reductase-like flavin-dependent oxidoreductase (luciferase family)